ncbi:MAG: non-canonical purine NTP pyrophosphatase [Vicinamibacterales bacterium]
MKLLLATTNLNKVREVTPLLEHLNGIEWLTLSDIPPIVEPPESSETYWENAREKALAYAGASGLTVVAEDSGFEVERLDGVPGIHSARFLGPDVPYSVRFQEITKRLAALGATGSEARFVTALAVARGDEILFETEAWIAGEVADSPRGDKGFGYDPLFFYPPQGKTTGEMTIEEKSAVSHRARAFRDFARWLATQPATGNRQPAAGQP